MSYNMVWVASALKFLCHIGAADPSIGFDSMNLRYLACCLAHPFFKVVKRCAFSSNNVTSRIMKTLIKVISN
jgi:hypothetical protein